MADSFDQDFELLPADDTISVDDALLAASARIDDSTGLLIEPDAISSPFGRGWDFDFVKGQFRRQGRAPAQISGARQLVIWCEKTLRTKRFAHRIYSGSYGFDGPEVIGGVFTPGLAGQYEQAIKDALTVHDRITGVDDIRFTGSLDSDVLYVTFTIVTDDAEIIPVNDFGMEF